MDHNHKMDVAGHSATIMSQLLDDQVKYSILRLVEQEASHPETVHCKNCEKIGHLSWSCPEPKNWSKVQCKNCKEIGHTRFKCNKPPAESHDNIDSNSGGDDDEDISDMTATTTLVSLADSWHHAISVHRDGKRISYFVVPLPPDVSSRKGVKNPLLHPSIM